MRFVIQRVNEASVSVDKKIVGKINSGFMVLVGVSNDDTRAVADKMVSKMTQLRIFEDHDGKTNLSLHDVAGSLLLISQFTLYADCKKGNRPSFINAGKPDLANEMFEYVVSECRKKIDIVETGIFAADMKVSLINDGPFTIILVSDVI